MGTLSWAALATGAGVGLLGDLIGLGGAEFRLPLLPDDPSRAESEIIMERLLLSPEQVAESLGVCRSRVYELMRT
jgi:hypothetical protein